MSSVWTDNSDLEEYQIISKSGLFDSQYYLEIYGHHIVPGQEPLDHFLQTGLARGYKPSADFDPILYRYLVPQCGRANPLIHCIKKFDGSFEHKPLEEIFGRFVDQFPLWRKGKPKKQNTNLFAAAREVERLQQSNDSEAWENNPTIRYSRNVAWKQRQSFDVKGQQYDLLVPPPDYFLDLIRNNQPFSFARLPHGFWDALLFLETMIGDLKVDPRAVNLTDLELSALARRIGLAVLPHHGAFVEDFMDETISTIPMHANSPHFFRAISFKGYPTPDEELVPERFYESDKQQRFELLGRYFRPEEEIYDAVYFKRLLISGDLAELPGLCRERPVILVANDFFRELGERWQLDSFTHINIPPALSQWHRQNLLDEISTVVETTSAQAGPRPIVLLQCGGSLAFWLINRLYSLQPDVTYLDLGQALNGWFLDLTRLDVKIWDRLYRRAIVDNCELHNYYKAYLAEEFEPWYFGETAG